MFESHASLQSLPRKDRQQFKLLILRIKLSDTHGLDIKRLSGHSDLFRVKRNHYRIVYRKTPRKLLVVRIDRKK